MRIRQFPAVVHPRHARELLVDSTAQNLTEWTAGYAITLPEHRRLIEDLLASLAWGKSGQAVLVNGVYGTGKSHLLVLLHLLSVLPEAWTSFLEAHPTFRRYEKSVKEHRRLIVHFSLDEYGPQCRIEHAISEEVTRALTRAGINEMREWSSHDSRPDSWAHLLKGITAHGYDGLLLLVDELSLFLAGKSPARREEDAAFLQFLAGWTTRAPLWLLGTLQRNLSDIGALRTHSWRQVEDRFHRFTLLQQEIGRVLHEKLIQRTDPPGIRHLVATQVIPAAEAHHLTIPAAELQAHWPFHPRAIDLLMDLANGYLSPHRSAVEVLQLLGQPEWLQRPADRLITPLDLFGLVEPDLRRMERLEHCWQVVNQLADWGAAAPDPSLAKRLLDLLSVLHLAERTATVSQMCELLFDGIDMPAVVEISRTLHHLRRYGAYVAVVRNADPGAEVFRLEIDDEVGALAGAQMQEIRHEFTPDDSRIIELALATCTDLAWPLESAMTDSLRLAIPWCGADRHVLLSIMPVVMQEMLVRLYEGLLARQADGHILLHWPQAPSPLEAWHTATALLTGPATGTFILWLPRPLTDTEHELWREYAAWQRTAMQPAPAGTQREKRARQRCHERAEELRPAVQQSVIRLYLEGHWVSAGGAEGKPGELPTCAQSLADMLAPGFSELFPLFPTVAVNGVPSRTAMQQLLAYFIEPGQITLTPQAVLGEYIEQFALPLGCGQIEGMQACVTPPRWEILEPLLTHCTEPCKYADVLALLQQPPLGLTTEHARLALSAAVRTGALKALDGFLQPLDPGHLSFVHSDTIAFLAAPTATDECHRSVVMTLASCWQLPQEIWTITCNQVEQRLQHWLETWTQRLPVMRETLADWTEVLHVLPWAWQISERQLAVLARLLEVRQGPFETLLTVLERENEGQLPEAETLWEACNWWRAHRAQVALLTNTPVEAELQTAVAQVRAQLAEGEGSFANLAILEARITEIVQQHREHYRRWHDEIFGSEVVSALRQAFEQAEFRAVKVLRRLPLAHPQAAEQCLEALALARVAYCPGVLTRLEMDGVCARCRLPYGSDSPMPNAADVRTAAAEALSAYAQLLQQDPWIAGVRQRVARAPENIAAQVQGILGWQPADGAEKLIALLDERILDWFCRGEQPAKKRQLRQLQERIAGHDLTLAEARAAMLGWLDPDGELGDDALLAFE